MKTKPFFKKTITNLRYFAVLLLIAGIASCEKDETPEVNDNPSSSSIQFGDGTLVAVKSETIQSTPVGDITINIGTAVAAFNAGSNYSTLSEAGTVKVNNEQLQKYDNNSYVFTPGATLPTGIEYGSSVDWSVSGNGNVPAFEHSVSGGFPSVGVITSGAEVSKSGYTFTIASISNADSIYFLVNDIHKSLAGNATSCNFSAAELSSLSAGTAIITAAAWRYTTAAYGGKNFYFVNETVKQKTVSITN